MSKIKIKESIYSEDKNIGDIVVNDSHLFIVVYTEGDTFNGIVIKSDRFTQGSIRYGLIKSDFRRFKGTIIVG